MKHFRIWWQKPRVYSEQEPERRVTFLELFYDLVYVVIIAELSHALAPIFFGIRIWVKGQISSSG